MLNQVKGGGFLVGIDLHSHQHEVGSHFKDFIRKSNTGFVFCDATSLPFRDEIFDIVFSNEFVSHVYDIERTLVEQIRVLKTLGMLTISDTNILNPHVFFGCFVVNWIQSRSSPVKRGGLRWLLHRDAPFCEKTFRGKRIVNVFWKDENIHSPFYWKQKLKNVRRLTDVYVSTFWSKISPESVEILGNKIWMEAKKNGGLNNVAVRESF